jgi:hypothetical protein
MSTLQEERRKQALAERAKKAGLPEWQQEMVENVGSDVVADVVRDFRRGLSPPSSIAGGPTVQHKKQGGSGWSEPLPLSNPPGVQLADRLMDQQDQIDRIRRKRMLKGLPPDDAA